MRPVHPLKALCSVLVISECLRREVRILKRDPLWLKYVALMKASMTKDNLMHISRRYFLGCC